MLVALPVQAVELTRTREPKPVPTPQVAGEPARAAIAPCGLDEPEDVALSPTARHPTSVVFGHERPSSTAVVEGYESPMSAPSSHWTVTLVMSAWSTSAVDVVV